MCSCLKEKPPRTYFDPSGSHSANRGGVNFKYADKQMIEKIKQLHKSSFLINPTTNLFPLSGHSGNRGVSIMINFESKIWNMELKQDQIYYPANQINSSKKEISRKRRKWHRRESPQGGWGMGSKEPIQRMILLQRLQYKSTNKT